MVELNGELKLSEFIRVVRGGAEVSLGAEARRRVRESREYIEQLVAKGEAVYGVNTGFGKFQNVRIEPDQLKQLQRNLILSHAIGVGEPFDTEVVRGMLLLRAASLAQGHSGVRPEVIELLLEFLHGCIRGTHQGSVGRAATWRLGHLALALIGEGEVSTGSAGALGAC